MTVVINGSTGVDTVQDGIVTDAKLSLSANSQEIKDALNAGGSAPIYACRAWVNFNGTGTVAIRASGNVSSITDNGTGDYTVNFTTAMPDANYSFVSIARSNNCSMVWDETAVLSGSVRITTKLTTTAVATDSATVNVAIFR